MEVINFVIFANVMAISVDAQGGSNMVIQSHTICGKIPNEVPFYATPRNFNPGLQAVDINFTVPYPVGENILVKVKLEKESPITENSWIYLISFEVKEGFCVFGEKYIGELMFAVERAAGIPPKMCPIPTGVYHINNMNMDYRNLRMPVMPSGRTKMRIELIHKQKNTMVSCHVFIISNQ